MPVGGVEVVERKKEEEVSRDRKRIEKRNCCCVSL
jgi:hypothetical protein